MISPKSLLIIILCSVAFLYCEKENENSAEVLATVGNRIITVEDFRERAELTTRPEYCSGKDVRDKGIVLNTLIAEKILALEGENDQYLVNNKNINNYVQGVKEQTMRNRLLQLELQDQLEITDQEKGEALRQATKKLHVAFLFSRSKEEVTAWRREFDRTSDFDSLEKRINEGKPPHLKEVLWGENLPSIDNALFNDSVTVGSIVGPVETKVGYYLMKVIDLRREIILGQGSTETKLGKIESVLYTRKWNVASAGYVYELMKDKDIALDADGFGLLLAYYRPTHVFPETKEEYLQLEQEELARAKRKAEIDLKNNLDMPLLTVNGTPWTMGEFIEYTRRRPITFKARRMQAEEFPHYLKVAIKEIIRDKYLTEEAYRKHLDGDAQVLREENRWRDHMLAFGKRSQMLEQLGFQGKVNEDYAEAIDLLRPQLNALAQKHKIDINLETFNKTPLTGVQWFAVRQGMPYQQVVPPFPIMTNDERLDYFTGFSEFVKNE